MDDIKIGDSVQIVLNDGRATECIIDNVNKLYIVVYHELSGSISYIHKDEIENIIRL